MTVIVLSKPSCVQCTATVRALKSAGIKHLVRDMTVDPSALAWARSLGYSSAPVVVAGDKHWSGFRPENIEQLVKSMNGEKQ